MTADEWADEIAGQLPPLTSAEADAAGWIAATLDARRGMMPARTDDLDER
jgi:hypothetical protein